jgi:hypothetical protein
MRRPIAVVVLCVLAASAIGACGPSPAEVAADLCHDLDALRGTLGFLHHPPDEATVGLIRAAVDRLDPTFTRVSEDDVVPAATAARLVGAQSDYREVLDPYGDDEPIPTVRPALQTPARRLLDAVAVAHIQLGCDDA